MTVGFATLALAGVLTAPPASPAPSAPSAPSAASEPAADDAATTATATPPVCVQPVVRKPREAHRPRRRRRRKPAAGQALVETHTDRGAAETQANGIVDATIRPVESPVVSILGKRVEGPTGEDMGRVVDVLADANGRVRVAIIDFGGFLGVGNRRIAVDWPLLRFHPTDAAKPLVLNVSREKLMSAPAYKESGHPDALMVPASAESATSSEAPPPLSEAKQ